MNQDKLNQDQALRLEAWDRAAQTVGLGSDPGEILERAKEIEAYLRGPEAMPLARPTDNLAASRVFDAVSEAANCWSMPGGTFDGPRAHLIASSLLNFLGFEVPTSWQGTTVRPAGNEPPGNELIDSIDAALWAARFVNIFGGRRYPGEGTMLAWFAGAIEAGRMAAEPSQLRAETVGDDGLRVTLHCELKEGEHSYSIPELVARMQDVLRDVTKHDETMGWIITGVTL